MDEHKVAVNASQLIVGSPHDLRQLVRGMRAQSIIAWGGGKFPVGFKINFMSRAGIRRL